MSLLTDDEIRKLFHPLHDTGIQFARAVEAAIHAKLASAELPEPQKYPADCFMREVNVCDALAVSFAIQKAFAQGAASQLAEKPTCWITPDGEGFRLRLSPPVNEVAMGWQELYTRKEANK